MARSVVYIVSAALWLAFNSYGWAATEEEWKDRAIAFVVQFEGSAYDKVTLDTDCQGLSLGKEQYTVKGNSVRDLFREILGLTGRDGLAAIVKSAFADGDEEFMRFIDEALQDSPRRMGRVRSWQEIRRSGRWVELDEGECSSGAKRNIAPGDIRLRPPFDRGIAAFLRADPVKKAQERLIARRGRVALQRAACWARSLRNGVPTFQEFLFFFDYLIQNGDSFTHDGSLQKVALTMPLGADAVSWKVTQLKEWLEADFAHMRRGRPDHGDYAKQNALIWERHFKAGKVSTDQIRLAYVGLMRAMLGNNQWAYAAMNRRGTIAFGGGIVNGRPFEAAAMTKLFDAGAIEQASLEGIRCP